jgi:hypothetical protein
VKVRDKANKVMVDVAHKECPTRECYWPRPDPGVFTQGVGYRARTGTPGWLCGNREIHGCPRKYCTITYGAIVPTDAGLAIRANQEALIEEARVKWTLK